MTDVYLDLQGISKSFPGVQALDNVDFDLRKGEVHGLVGENGAGKSTLIKIIMGIYKNDSGNIFLEGEEIGIHNPSDAIDIGFRAIYQDVNLCRHLTVAENLLLGKQPRKGRIVNWKSLYERAQNIIDDLALNIDVHAQVRTLSVAQQEMVCIAKSVYEEAKVIIFDEPTALLTEDETVRLFNIIRDLKEREISVIYISHRLEEIFEICDRTTILRDGKKVCTVDTDQLTEDEMISLMVGRTFEDLYISDHVSNRQDEVVLEVKDLSKEGKYKDISFDLHKGEILGISGLVGAGRSDIMKALFGAEKFDKGSISIHGKETVISSPMAAIRNGLAYLPEDRRHEGLALGLTVSENLNMTSFQLNHKFGLVDGSNEKTVTDTFIEKLDIRTPSSKQQIAKLSGGNQQKVVIGKWLAIDSDILIFDEPTIGVDVGTKREIYKLLYDLTAQGKSLIVISSYLPEVIGVSDRVMVIHEGKNMGFLEREELSEVSLLRMASGLATADEIRAQTKTGVTS